MAVGMVGFLAPDFASAQNSREDLIVENERQSEIKTPAEKKLEADMKTQDAKIIPYDPNNVAPPDSPPPKTETVVTNETAPLEDSQRYGSGDFIPCSGTNCSACDLVKLANSIVTWLIGIVGLLFGVLMVVAGFKLVLSGGNQGALDTAKKMLTNGLIGFLIVLGAWLFVDTLMKALLGDSGELKGYGPWSQIECWKQNETRTLKYEADESAFADAGGDSGVDGSGMQTSGGTNCPVPAASQMVDIPTKYTRNGASIKIRSDMLANFERMYAAAKSEGVTITVMSGWRSDQMQVNLWNKYNGVSAVAKPCSMNGGGSNHNSGLAIDVVLNSCKKTTSNCKDPIFLWLKSNGAQYGFKNTFPSSNLDNVHWSQSGR